MNKKIIKQIPNILTISRIILIIISFILLLKGYDLASIILVTIASITDFFDGMLARKLNAITKFGLFVDPLADKVFEILMVIALGIVKVKEIYYLVLFESLYFIINIYYWIRFKKWQSATMPSKAKTWMFFSTVVCLLLSLKYSVFSKIAIPLIVLTIISQIIAVVNSIKITILDKQNYQKVVN